MPDERTDTNDRDFAGEMHDLAYEAQSKAGPAPAPRFDRKELLLAMGQLFRPIAQELESIKRGTSENNALLAAVGKSVQQQTPPGHSLEDILQQLQRLGSIETANQKLFDALHGELKGYKDNFLFDALQRPVIRDLVSIFDDFSALHFQMLARLEALGPVYAEETVEDASTWESESAFLQNLAGNMNNQLHHITEIFERMEVVLSQSPPGTALDKRVHRIVAFEAAVSEHEDGQVARSLKPGFTWHERIIRPEDVVLTRWYPEKETFSEAPSAAQPEPVNE